MKSGFYFITDVDPDGPAGAVRLRRQNCRHHSPGGRASQPAGRLGPGRRAQGLGRQRLLSTHDPRIGADAHQLENPVSIPDLSNTANVAIVALSVDLPSEGIRNGDRLDVKVNAIGTCTSLKGGILFIAPLTGPTPDSGLFGMASGDIVINDPPTGGIIRQGALMEVDLPVEVIHNDAITLILSENAAPPRHRQHHRQDDQRRGRQRPAHRPRRRREMRSGQDPRQRTRPARTTSSPVSSNSPSACSPPRPASWSTGKPAPSSSPATSKSPPWSSATRA